MARLFRSLFFWTAMVPAVSVLTGTASAFFLWSLDAVTRVRFENGWLFWLLPLAALLSLWAYHRYGGEAGKGTDLILDRIHAPGAGVPFRLMPLVLAGSLLTHLCGGSAGREGTAVQMGGGLAGGLLGWFRVAKERHPFVLMAGVAAGFGSVFGTPVAGAVFAVEVLTVGRFRMSALPLCLAASFLADAVCHAWGADQTQNWPTHLICPCLHRKVFKDAFLDLLKPVMILIQHGFGRPQILFNLALFFPRNG